MLNRGNEAIMDTTFLSLMATPIAGLLGMMIAFLVVRKMFSGKDVIDFGSNLGAGVPGTILGIGFILSFVTSPWLLVFTLYIVMALFLARTLYRYPPHAVDGAGHRLATGALALVFAEVPGRGRAGCMCWPAGYLVLAAYFFFGRKNRRAGWMLVGLGGYLIMSNLIWYIAQPIADLSRQIDNSFWSDVVFQISDYIQVPFQMPAGDSDDPLRLYRRTAGRSAQAVARG